MSAESPFDALCKALAERGAGSGLSRREALRLAAGLAAASLGASLGLHRLAWALPPASAACRQFCRRYPAGSQRNQCLFVCRQCRAAPRRPVCQDEFQGGAAICCQPGERCCATATAARCCPANRTCCGSDCVDRRTDSRHCGRCNHPCAANQECVNGRCVEVCQPGFAPCRNTLAIAGNPEMTCCLQSILCCNDGICHEAFTEQTGFCCEGTLSDGTRLVRACPTAVASVCCNLACCTPNRACCAGVCCREGETCCAGDLFSSCCPAGYLCCPSGECFGPINAGEPPPGSCCPKPPNALGQVRYLPCPDAGYLCCHHSVLPDVTWCCPPGTQCHPTAFPVQCTAA